MSADEFGVGLGAIDEAAMRAQARELAMLPTTSDLDAWVEYQADPAWVSLLVLVVIGGWLFGVYSAWCAFWRFWGGA